MFVENAAHMAVHRDLDHRYYEYPGLFFDLLAPLLAAGGVEEPPASPAYLAARRLVALLGVAAVALVYVLGRRLTTARAALLGALLLAVSPIPVDVAHMVRPDVALEVFVLAAALAFLRLDGSWRRDLLAGAALGAAAAVKFTGALLAPSYLLARGLAARPAEEADGTPWWRGVAVAALAALVVLVVSTPYAILHAPAFLAGVRVQVGYHYERSGGGIPPSYLSMVAVYLGVVRRALGPAAWLLLAAPLLVRPRRAWMALLAFPVLLVLVFATSSLKRDRFLVPALGLLALAVAAVVERAAGGARVRWGSAAGHATFAILAVLAVVPPLVASLRWLGQIRAPGTWDRALDWVEANVPEGARLASDVPDLGLDSGRHEIVPLTGDDALDRLVAEDAGHLVANPWRRGLVAPFREAFRADPPWPHAGPAIGVYAPREPPPYRPLPLEAAAIRVSEQADAVPAMVDGNPATAWTTAGPQRPGQWIEVDLSRRATLGRVELRLGNRPARRGAALRVHVRVDGAWRPVRAVAGRPPVEEQVAAGREPSQVLLLEPVRADALRILQTGTDERRWAVAELALAVRD